MRNSAHYPDTLSNMPRFPEPASQSQPPVVAVEEELIPIEDVESDSEGSEEEEDESEAEAEAEDEEEEDVGSGVQHTEAQPVSGGQNRPVGSSFPATAPPGFNNAIGALIVVLTDPHVLDCPICLDPLSTPVFQCENGHLACSSCCNRVERKCPSCCMPIGYNRCKAIENFLKSIKKIDNSNEQTNPHTICFCPQSSCPFFGFFNNLNLHFGIQHASSTTRFTYNTTFTLPVELNQKHIFLQEQHESVIFILNHEVKQHGRVFNIDCVGPSTLKTCFLYELTAKHMETSFFLQSVPEIYAKWSEHTPIKKYLTVPTEFAGYNGILSLHVCIEKAVLSV